MDVCGEYNNTRTECIDLSNTSTFHILGLLVPNCEKGSWTAITSGWIGAFYLFVVLSVPFYLFIGAICLLFLYKRRVAKRFKTKSFVAIDIALSILGFSRVVFYIIDPYGVSGFCTHPGCVIVSRLLYSLGFPSLTASYTLVFLTLWQSARLRLRRTAAEHWNVIIPLCCIHYFVAVIVEVIGVVGPYPVVFLLIGCELAFMVWGFAVCVAFIIAGTRLLHSVRTSARQSSVVCRDTTLTREPGTHGSLTKVQTTMRIKGTFRRHHKQAIRKVTIITYISALLGSLYSILGLAQLVLNVMELFGSCSTGYSSNSNVWLLLRYAMSGVEVALALLLIYSSNDLRPFIHKLQTVCNCMTQNRTSMSADDQKSKESKNNFQFSYDSKGKHYDQKEISATSTSLQGTIKLPTVDSKEERCSNDLEYVEKTIEILDNQQDIDSGSNDGKH